MAEELVSSAMAPLIVGPGWTRSFVIKFRDRRIVWLSNPNDNEIKVRFLQAMFPEHKLVSTFQYMKQLPASSVVHIVGPIVKDDDIDILNELFILSNLATEHNLKIVVTSPNTVLDALKSTYTVRDYFDILSRVTNFTLEDEDLLTGKDELTPLAWQTKGWKGRFQDWFREYKPIWIMSPTNHKRMLRFIERLFPGQVLSISKNFETLSNAPTDKIITMGNIDVFTFRGQFVDKMISVINLVKDKKMRVIITSDDLIRYIIPQNMTVANLREVENGMAAEICIHYKIIIHSLDVE